MKNDVKKTLATFYAWILIIAALVLLLGRLGISHGVDFFKPSDLLFFSQLISMFLAGYSLYSNSKGMKLEYDSITFILLSIVQVSLLLFAYGGISEINELPIFYSLIFLLIFVMNLLLVYWYFIFYKRNHKR